MMRNKIILVLVLWLLSKIDFKGIRYKNNLRYAIGEIGSTLYELNEDINGGTSE